MIFKYLQRDKSAKAEKTKPDEHPDATSEDATGEPASENTDWVNVAAPLEGRSAALGPQALRRMVDPGTLGFSTTAELTPAAGLIGQDRALE
ncbi:MAG TPA: hypothetical protein P5114_11310, partial [Hyphomicrobiaceae bacterium]|nr:hypothetical protein [Hyphomicrobiaceae bacterium]